MYHFAMEPVTTHLRGKGGVLAGKVLNAKHLGQTFHVQKHNLGLRIRNTPPKSIF